MERLKHLPRLIPLLDAALRSRPESPQALAALTGRGETEIAAALHELEQFGFLGVTNDVITYRQPDAAAAGLTESTLTELGRRIGNALDEVQLALGAVPGLVQAWAEGTSGAPNLQVDVAHGPWAPADMWRLQFSRRVSQRSDVCMPSTAALFAPQQEYQAAFWASRSDQPVAVRLLMSVEDATHPAGAERIAGELSAGVQIRMHPRLPSFFWTTDDDTIGVPLSWGEPWPASVMAIQSPALAAAFRWIYERLWNEAEPIELLAGAGSAPAWDPMLRLMNQGLTIDAASATLGIAPRTGRRRVADAMAHFGVSSHFALGAAWGQAR